MKHRNAIALAAGLFVAAITGAAFSHGEGDETAEIELILNQPEGPVAADEGLAAWERIYAVASHPRCSNCHVGDDNIPRWSGPSYGEGGPHGMNIHAGPSRIGIETLPCMTCHVQSTEPNTVPHAPPHAGLTWMLAPVEFAWFGKDSSSVCEQMRDPARNGGRDGDGLVEHILHDAEVKAFISWGFNPGGGREAAPGTMQTHLDDMVLWTSAGMPCPGEAEQSAGN